MLQCILWFADLLSHVCLRVQCTQVGVCSSQAWHLPFSPLYNILHHINPILFVGLRVSGEPCESHCLVGLLGLVSVGPVAQDFKYVKSWICALYLDKFFSIFNLIYNNDTNTTCPWIKTLLKKLEDIWFLVPMVQPFLFMHVSLQHMHNWHKHWRTGARSLLRCLACSPLIRSILGPPYKKQSAYKMVTLVDKIFEKWGGRGVLRWWWWWWRWC